MLCRISMWNRGKILFGHLWCLPVLIIFLSVVHTSLYYSIYLWLNFTKWIFYLWLWIFDIEIIVNIEIIVTFWSSLLVTNNSGKLGVWRLAFGVWRLAFGVWHLAFGVWRRRGRGRVRGRVPFVIVLWKFVMKNHILALIWF